ncbi:hypothetical protein ES319_D03G146800v1 [Gossypium barbadense]|uniref:Uncharacterized protein n=1 Tax=Gossypium barbadense TaxID=3634 RepID=A0A5J5S5T5_GOSBA|nr:hypothetical protein ES319_D03G146800v1 [Gossypium barbadense]
MLNRFIALKAKEKKKPKERHHFLASECRDLAVAKKWDQQIMREISHKVTEAKHAPKMTNLKGNIVDVPNPSGRGPGYRYFKAAKKLPRVKKLFEKQPELRKRRTTDDIYKSIDASYYGYRDEVLARVKGPTEAKMRTKAEEEWQRVLFEEEEDVMVEEMREREEKERKDKEREFFVHVPLPDDKEIERMIVERKKMELLSKYASEGLLEEQSEAMDILNIYS